MTTSADELAGTPFDEVFAYPGPVDRFHASIKVDAETGCWIWQGKRRSLNGYGRFYVDGREIAAHRYAYQHYVESVGPTERVDHRCSRWHEVLGRRITNRLCVNPNHLQKVSGRNNTLLGVGPTAANARKTTCKRGHPLTGPGADVRIRKRGKHGRERVCRRCQRERSK